LIFNSIKQITIIAILCTSLISYEKPSFFDPLKNQIDALKGMSNLAFKKSELDLWYIVAGTTLVAWYYDEELVDASKSYSKTLGIDSSVSKKKLFCFTSGTCIYVPVDMGTSLYFIGDGVLHTAIAGGFLTHGLIYDNVKSMNVSSQIIESMFASGLVTQFLKHIAGRESPFKKTRTRGKWDLLPNQIDYHEDIPRYDAYPSGHITAFTSTITVLYANYPKYSDYIMGSGLILGTVLMIEMMSRGVHWGSDYPLGIAIGYYSGKYISDREINKHNLILSFQSKSEISFTPIISDTGALGIGIRKVY
jgi:hypothetical protein